MPAFANDNARIQSAAYQANEVSTALDLAKNKQFDQALRMLSFVPPAKQNTYEFRFAQARILSWSGRYQSAAHTYRGLLSEYPNNPDVLVSAGYLELFHGNLNIAEQHFGKVVRSHPDYVDAHRGLQRTYQAKQKAALTARTEAQVVHCRVGEAIQADGTCRRVF